MIAPARVLESAFGETPVLTGQIPEDAARLVAALLLDVAERGEAEAAAETDRAGQEGSR
jgi:hypothetical protein